jgi:excisionase family DNA binding protein
MENERAVLSVEEVAKILGICEALVRREIKAKKIPAVKVGDRYLIPKTSFARWLSVESRASVK